ncbi:MAG: DNA mismatch repair protein MutS, partial [Treponema sp.]|nr:DNA mismatch repair protein MutS [Treponema sp.]
LFDMEGSGRRLERQFGATALKGFGLEPKSPEILCAGAILDYLDNTARSLLPHVRAISVYGDSQFVGIDEASMKNLEIARNMRDGSERHTLVETMDETCCAMGKRLLRFRILRPLRDLEKIRARLDMVDAARADQAGLGALRETLSKTPDLERLCARLAMDRAHGKDMLSICNALARCERARELREAMGLRCEEDADSGESALSDAQRLVRLRELLESAIPEDPAIVLSEGNLIRDGYSAELDSLRELKDSGVGRLDAYLEEERRATGIPGLRIRYNRMIGYFFEVATAYVSRVPSRFIRRQGVAGAERFSTDRLAALESEVNGAQGRIHELERELFLALRERAKEDLPAMAAEARRLAETDVAQSGARCAALRGWTRPELDDSGALEAKAARHPVVEASLGPGEFIPNDINIHARSPRGGADASAAPSFAMITGPNMAGKSTYLRSAALVALMAQAGSFVPASSARVGICDRIFCRVGASDNLARGESTFLVEMNETACIINTASEKSLVIMDEVGRGTAARDGLSIAWAVSEELLTRIGCRAFFATHYHELAHLEHPAAANFSMEVLEKDGNVVFLRHLREGPAKSSYGLHVARLAGLPNSVLTRAAEIMARLTDDKPDSLPTVAPPALSQRPPEEKPANPAAAEALRIIAELDTDRIAPIDALSLLIELKGRLAGTGAPARDTPPPRSRPAKTARGDQGPTLGLFD